MLTGIAAIYLLLASPMGMGPSMANAGQAVEAGFLPISLSQPLGYEDAFKGTGIFLGASHYFPAFNGGAHVSYIKQGKGSSIGLLYRQYVLGGPQIKLNNADAPDPKDRPLMGEFRHYGLYLELGGNIYSMQRNYTDDVAGTTTVQSASGLGILGGVGFEYPVLSFLFTSAQASVFNSLGGPANMLLFQVGVGYPFNLF